MILQSQMYLWVILIGKAEAVPLSGMLQLTILVAIVDDAVTTAMILDGFDSSR
jgi:hypothetical protein